ncbi:MAG: hypothetical protein E7157_04855 [Lactobacillales bacterium]|nr:hypothetical protein [Lactobacillales bacterium]
MVSRMEKYYKNEVASKQRSQKNKDLYRSIYDDGEYSNIEGIATMDKNNEIDITKVRNTLKNRENYKRQKQYRQITKQKDDYEEKNVSRDFTSNEQKNYDIRDILNKARDKKPVEDTPRSLDNTNYNILKSLKLNSEKDHHKEFEDDELKELINTITSTSMLNQMNDKELGLNMFDLEETTENKIEGKESVKQLLEQAKKYQENKSDTIPDLDDSFYTSSLNFNKEDFEEANDYIKKKKSKKILSKILLFVGLIVVTGLIIFGVYYLIK